MNLFSRLKMNNNLIFTIITLLFLLSFILAETQIDSQATNNPVLTQNIQSTIDEQTKITTYTFTSSESALKLNGNDYWNIKPADANTPAYIKVDENGRIKEVDITASKETTFTINDSYDKRTFVVNPENRLVYKNGKFSIIGKKEEIIKYSKNSQPLSIKLNDKQLYISNEISGKFKLLYEDREVDIDGAVSNPYNGNKVDILESEPSTLFATNAIIHFNGASVVIRGSSTGDKSIPIFGNENNGGVWFDNENKFCALSSSFTMDIIFKENNPWIPLNSGQNLQFDLGMNSDFRVSTNSEVKLSTTSSITERNGGTEIIFDQNKANLKTTSKYDPPIALTRKFYSQEGKEYNINNGGLSTLPRTTVQGKHDSVEDAYVTSGEFINYIKKIEERWPRASKEDIILTLFHERYSGVWNKDYLPGFEHKIDSIGWSDLYKYATTEGSDQNKGFGEIYSRLLPSEKSSIAPIDLPINNLESPSHITLPDGSTVKIAHVIAGLAGHISGRENAKARGGSEKEGIKEGAILAYSITEVGNLFEVYQKIPRKIVYGKAEEPSLISQVKSFIKEYNKDDETGQYPASQKRAATWSAKSKRLIDKYDKLSDLMKAIYEQNGYTIE